jgi:hypothetical protein
LGVVQSAGVWRTAGASEQAGRRGRKTRAAARHQSPLSSHLHHQLSTSIPTRKGWRPAGLFRRPHRSACALPSPSPPSLALTACAAQRLAILSQAPAVARCIRSVAQAGDHCPGSDCKARMMALSDGSNASQQLPSRRLHRTSRAHLPKGLCGWLLPPPSAPALAMLAPLSDS